jgi:hypothetical protein
VKTKTLGVLILTYAVCIIAGAIGLAYVTVHFIAKFW